MRLCLMHSLIVVTNLKKDIAEMEKTPKKTSKTIQGLKRPHYEERLNIDLFLYLLDLYLTLLLDINYILDT